MKRVYVDLQPILGKKTGIGWYVENIVKRIGDNRDYDITGCFFDFLCRNNSKEECEKSGIYSYVNQKYLPAKVYKLCWNLMPIKYDRMFPGASIYHFFNYVVPPISDEKKVIITVYDMAYKLFPETLRSSNLLLLNRHMDKSITRADHIVVISESSKKDLQSFYDVDDSKISIISPGVDQELFTITYDKEKQLEIIEKYGLPSKYFLYLGTIEPRKNISSIIRAYKNLSDEIKREYKLVIAGGKGWKNDEIYRLPSTLAIEEHVIFTGYVSEVDKPYIYKGAEMFLFPSLYEGFGMPIIESMACGVPVITSNISSMPEIAGNAAILVNPKDDNSITNAIIKLLSDKELKNKKIALGYKQAKKYTWDEAARRTVDLYRKL